MLHCVAHLGEGMFTVVVPSRPRVPGSYPVSSISHIALKVGWTVPIPYPVLESPIKILCLKKIVHILCSATDIHSYPPKVRFIFFS